MRGSAECTAVDLGEGEDRVVGSDDHVRVADQSDATADTESVDGHDDGYSAVVDGGGIGLVGNADVIVASDDAVFGLPEVDRGALGAATHLARLVPQHMMRTLYYTAQNVTAQQLQHFGSVYEVVPREKLDDTARGIAATIAAKDTRVIRCAKEAINGIDPVDVKTSYRLEQGYTFELNLAGVSDEHRDEFVETGKPRSNSNTRKG